MTKLCARYLTLDDDPASRLCQSPRFKYGGGGSPNTGGKQLTPAKAPFPNLIQRVGLFAPVKDMIVAKRDRIDEVAVWCCVR